LTARLDKLLKLKDLPLQSLARYVLHQVKLFIANDLLAHLYSSGDQVLDFYYLLSSFAINVILK